MYYSYCLQLRTLDSFHTIITYMYHTVYMFNFIYVPCLEPSGDGCTEGIDVDVTVAVLDNVEAIDDDVAEVIWVTMTADDIVGESGMSNDPVNA